ncbi:hypothetical protein BDZ94DRAFT_1308850 [Collybia nuda]|uniref:Uncharacterized protein n=1 Tax=Collybia nuda TaxID=64659 RepID=A0A9P5Y6Z9_9AGAR|nr:hypothetical protein BDZ94DRAFT_1308850 [Collybia nuda]
MLRSRHTDTDNMEHQILGILSLLVVYMPIHRYFLVGGTIGMVIAAATTVARLAIRIQKFGWDEALAFAGLLCLIITGVTGKLYYSMKGAGSIPHNPRITMYYILAIGFDLTILLARISAPYSIIRFGRYQRQLHYAVSLFLTAVLNLVA